MRRFGWYLALALLPVGLWLGGCPDQFSTPPIEPDDDAGDDDASDDDATDDDVGDDDAGPTPEEVQDAVDDVLNWPVIDGCGTVTVYAVSPDSAVEIKFDANIDFGTITIPHMQSFDLPGPGAVLSLKAGEMMGSATCGGAGNPDVTDNYSVQGGTVDLVINNGPTATIGFENVDAQRVGGEEMIELPNVTLPAVTVGF